MLQFRIALPQKALVTDMVHVRLRRRDSHVTATLVTLELTVMNKVRHTNTGYYRWLRLLTRGQLADQSLNSLFTKTTMICETMENIC